MRRMVMLIVCVLALMALGVALHQTAGPLPTWSVVGSKRQEADTPEIQLLCGDRFVRSSGSDWCRLIDADSGTIHLSHPTERFRLQGTEYDSFGAVDKVLIGVPGGVEWRDPLSGRSETVQMRPDEEIWPSPDCSRLAIARVDSAQGVLHVRFAAWDGESFEIRAPYIQERAKFHSWLADGEHLLINNGGTILYHVPTRRTLAFHPHGSTLLGVLPGGRWLVFAEDPLGFSWVVLDTRDLSTVDDIHKGGGSVRRIVPISEDEVILYRDQGKKKGRIERWNLRSAERIWEFSITESLIQLETIEKNVLLCHLQAGHLVLNMVTGEADSNANLPIRVLMRNPSYLPHVLEQRLIASGLPESFVRYHASKEFHWLKLASFQDSNRIWFCCYDISTEENRPWWHSWALQFGLVSPHRSSFLLCQERDPPGTRFHFELPDRSDFVVSRDGSFLVLIESKGETFRITRYDLDGPKPWARIVGVPLGLGLVLLMLYALLRWWRRPR